jgi:thiamine-phosphate pyrophosphorylase
MCAKPDFSEEEMKLFLSKIKLEYRSQLVLHQLAQDFAFNRIHFTENARATLDLESTNSRDGFVKSTSTHTMADFIN